MPKLSRIIHGWWSFWKVNLFFCTSQGWTVELSAAVQLIAAAAYMVMPNSKVHCPRFFAKRRSFYYIGIHGKFQVRVIETVDQKRDKEGYQNENEMRGVIACKKKTKKKHETSLTKCTSSLLAILVLSFESCRISPQSGVLWDLCFTLFWPNICFNDCGKTSRKSINWRWCWISGLHRNIYASVNFK